MVLETRPSVSTARTRSSVVQWIPTSPGDRQAEVRALLRHCRFALDRIDYSVPLNKGGVVCGV